jgi:hypothetical protein
LKHDERTIGVESELRSLVDRAMSSLVNRIPDLRRLSSEAALRSAELQLLHELEGLCRPFAGEAGGRDGGALFEKFPLLAEFVSTAVRQWTASTAEAFGRLAADATELRSLFSVEFPVVDTTVPATAHRDDGRFVRMFDFANGTKLVYKPKHLGTEEAFDALAAWFADRGVDVRAVSPRRLSRARYGWMTYATRDDSRDPSEAYERRLGALAAVAHALGARDLHAHNVLRVENTPVIVDAETIIWCNVRRAQPLRVDDLGFGADLIDAETVLGTGLVPRWLPWNEGRTYDPSPLGSLRISSAPSPHVASAMCDAFAHTYDAVAALKDELLAETPAFFAGVQIRVLVRSNAAYENALALLRTPAALSDPAFREVLLARLARTLESHARLPAWRGEIARVEAESLCRGDIPAFHADAGGTTLYLHDPAGERSISGALEQTPLDTLRARLESLGTTDRNRQLAYMRTACELRSPTVTSDDEPLEVSRSDAGVAGRRLASFLTELALHRSGTATWCSLAGDGVLRPMAQHAPERMLVLRFLLAAARLDARSPAAAFLDRHCDVTPDDLERATAPPGGHRSLGDAGAWIRAGHPWHAYRLAADAASLAALGLRLIRGEHERPLC